jgi:hypothetical protein
MVIPIKINGVDKYFAIDTGAPNVITKELATELGVKSTVTQKTGDSGGQSEELSFVSINKIEVGNVVFSGFGAAIADFKASPNLVCLEIDGLIGANLMQKAFWKIDYQKKRIWLTDNIEKILSENITDTIPFYTSITGSPTCEVKFDGFSDKNVTIDLGSNGHIDLTYNKTKQFQSLRPEDVRYKVGFRSSGLFGKTETDTSYYFKTSTLKLGSLTYEQVVVELGDKENYESKIGMGYFENYTIILDWEGKKVYLSEKTPYQLSNLDTYGFGYQYSNGKLLVNSILLSQDGAPLSPLQVEDQILEINSVEFTNINQSRWCDIVKNGLGLEGQYTIKIIQAGETLTYEIDQQNLY